MIQLTRRKPARASDKAGQTEGGSVDAVRATEPVRSTGRGLRRLWCYRAYYFLLFPMLLYFFVFHYVPMWGVVIAFQEFRPWEGLFSSPWVGFENFRVFFNSIYFGRLLGNTLIISGLNILFAFPAPIVLALLLNEVRHTRYKRAIQTISYLPHFISWVVVGGLILYVFSEQLGIVNILLRRLGLPTIQVLGHSKAFLPLVTGSAIWKGVGWGAIIYLAAIAGVNVELYEAAMMDGANRFQRARHITIPAIMPVLVVMLVLRVGAFLSVDFMQILVLVGQDAGLYAVGDVIQTWVYRAAFFRSDWSLATAVGLFQGIFGLILVYAANWASNKVADTGLW